MSKLQDAYLVCAVRTAVGKRNGALKNTRPDDMLAHVIHHAVAGCAGLDAQEIADVVVGCAMPEAEQGMNVARIGALLAGLPQTVPAFTINRFCSSGVNAIAIAADRIRLGEAEVTIAAGTESMSAMTQIMGNKIAANPQFFAKNENHAIAFGMGLTAEKIAEQYQVSRLAQDTFALDSHSKALSAIAGGFFNDEIVPYPVTVHRPDPNSHNGAVVSETIAFAKDEGPRPDTTLEGLSKLKPAFSNKGSVTAGNSSQMSDGAGALVLMSEAALKRYGLKPLARFVSFAVTGVAPEVMGIGPITAIPKALALAGLKLSDLEHIELNEAFAAQSLAVIQTLGINPEVVNPYGGAIALGHPLGATGAIRAATLVHALRRRRQRYGMVTMCVGTGMGAAGIFESIH